MRSILAVTSGDARVVEAAYVLAERHCARLTVIEAWRAPLATMLLALSWIVLPVTQRELVEDAERQAAERARRTLGEAGRGIVVFCRRGGAAAVAAAELGSGGYDAVVVRGGFLARSLLLSALRRADAELVEVA